ncbi:MAG: hypothetical protein KGK10_03585 [Rhodospirillales bacterium]|nr:hypothetical protein [Rhodospirillales bacterium]
MVMTLLTGVGLTAAQVAQYWPTNPADAPPSPEGAFCKALAGQIGGAPYLVDQHGNVITFAKDGTGKLIPVTNQWGSGYEGEYNGNLSGATAGSTAYNQFTVSQGEIWLTFNGGFTGIGEVRGTLGGIREQAIPPFWTSSPSADGGATTSKSPAMPVAPTPSAIAPGSSGKTILFGLGQTYTTISAALAAAADGDTVKFAGVAASASAVFAESFTIDKAIVLDGAGVLTGGGTAKPSFAGGAVLDGASLVDYSGYAQGKGGIVLGGDCVVQGFEIRNFGLKEAQAGLTSGIRNSGPGNFTIRHCYVHDCQDGLGSGGFAAAWTLSDLWVERCGIGNGLTHDAYLGSGVVTHSAARVTMIIGPKVADTNTGTGFAEGGIAFKSRANTLSFTGPCYLHAADAACLNLDDGVTQDVLIGTGVVFHKDATDANHLAISLAPAGSPLNGNANLTLEAGVTLDLLCPAPEIVNGSLGTIYVEPGVVNSGGGTISVTGPCSYKGALVTFLPAGTL